jgi:hypothetical protein
MHDPPSRSSDDAAGTSILVLGGGEDPVMILAAALAARPSAPFAWANCSGSTKGLGDEALRRLSAGASQLREPRIDPQELSAPPRFAARLSDLVDPESIPSRERIALDDYLRLPRLLQRWIAAWRPEDGPARFLLTNADVLPSAVAQGILARPALHQTLHRERVTLVVTFRGFPSEEVRSGFDRVYRIEGAPGAGWSEALVTEERSPASDGPVPLGRLLRRLQ